MPFFKAEATDRDFHDPSITQEDLKDRARALIISQIELGENLLQYIDPMQFSSWEKLNFFLFETFARRLQLEPYTEGREPETRIKEGLKALQQALDAVDDPDFDIKLRQVSKWSRFLFTKAGSCIVRKDSGEYYWDQDKEDGVLAEFGLPAV